MTNRPALVALALSVLVVLPGCARRVSGFVTDSVTGLPVSSASLTVGERYTRVDTAGHYTIKFRYHDKNRLVFSARGYRSQSVKLKWPDEEQRFRDLDIQLVPEAADVPAGDAAPEATK